MRVFYIDNHRCKVDDCDYDLVMQYSWRIIQGYAYTGFTKATKITMQQLILGIKKNSPVRVRRFNHDRLDNRRENLMMVKINPNSRMLQRAQNNNAFNMAELKKIRNSVDPFCESNVRRPDMHELATNDVEWQKHIHNSLKRMWGKHSKE